VRTHPIDKLLEQHCYKSAACLFSPTQLGPKKTPVVPVLYREKIRVGRSETKLFLKKIFFMVLAVFCWAICSRVPTSILTRVAYFLWTNLGNLVQ
jgi:hypothetical protein